MTNLATKADTMEPMRINHRTHSIFFGKLIEHHISILGRCINAKAGAQDDEKHNYSLAFDGIIYAFSKHPGSHRLLLSGLTASIGLHSRFTEEGPSYNTVTTITFGQRKCNRAMALAAVITGQNSQHIDWISINFFDKYLVVAIVTVQPFGMRAMRK